LRSCARATAGELLAGRRRAEQPALAWRHSLAFGAGCSRSDPIAALGYGAVAIATEIEVVSHGFVQVGLTGVSLDDRHYQRGGREIRLVGMMHIGDPDRYRALTRSFAARVDGRARGGRVGREGRLASALHYGKAARAIGLAPQQRPRELSRAKARERTRRSGVAGGAARRRRRERVLGPTRSR
jgi:hypothetical protein